VSRGPGLSEGNIDMERYMYIKWWDGQEGGEHFSFSVEKVSYKISFLFQCKALLNYWYSAIQTSGIDDPRQRAMPHLQLLGQTVQVTTDGQTHSGVVLRIGICKT
jgi:hypothetical protein